MQRFLRLSQTGDINCLIKGEFQNVAAGDGTTLQQLFDDGYRVRAMTALDTGFVLLALESAGK